MTDERFVYNQEIRERKSAANGARAKKGGSRSKKCTLPSDGLSAAQKRKLNGSVESIYMNRPMTWENLLELTPSLQFLYLNHLINSYSARRVDLLSMFGISTKTFWTLQQELPGKLVWKYAKKKPAPEWLAFLANEQGAEVETYRYCFVTFMTGGAQYSYRTDDMTIGAGDEVLVPVGVSDSTRKAVVASVGDFPKDAVPYPLESTKFVISKVSEDRVKDNMVNPDDAPTIKPVENETPEIISGSIKVRSTASGMLRALLRLLDDPDAEFTFTVSFEK